MPVFGQTDKIGDLLEEVANSLLESPPAPIVNVAAPNITVPPAVVNVNIPEEKDPRVWTFSVERKDGLITSITATAK